VPYFHSGAPGVYDESYSYADGVIGLKNTRQYNWSHSLSETMINAGLVIDSCMEHQEMDWEPLPGMIVDENGHYRLPDQWHDLVPLMFSIKAHKPE